MKFESTEKGMKIIVEDNENEMDVLKSIAQASYNTAGVVGMGVLQDFTQPLSAGMLDSLIYASSDRPLRMDYVNGRQCKTFISKNEDGELVLNKHLFERDRGDASAMLMTAGGTIVVSK